MTYRTLYPDRQEVYCKRCRCWHFKDGRCFAQDAVGWPIIFPIVYPHARPPASRLTGAETKQAIQTGKAWWT